MTPQPKEVQEFIAKARLAGRAHLRRQVMAWWIVSLSAIVFIWLLRLPADTAKAVMFWVILMPAPVWYGVFILVFNLAYPEPVLVLETTIEEPKPNE